MSVLEITAVIFTFICVILTTKQNIWCWPTGIVGVIAFFLLYFEQKLYVQGSIQVIFLIQSIFGWYNWTKIKDGDVIHVTKRGKKEFKLDLVILGLGTAALTIIMSAKTDSALPFLDAFSAGLSLLANYYLTKKYLQAWPLWMSVNVLLASIFFYQGLVLAGILEVILLGISINGFIQWRKDLKQV